MGVSDGKKFYKSHVDSMKRIRGPAKSMLDKQWARMIIDHNLPARMHRYENFRCFLNNLVIASGGNSLYPPPANDAFLEESLNEQQKTKLKIKNALNKAAEALGQLPFLIGQHDE